MARADNGRFLKGETGNPNGRPSKTREVRFHEVTLQAVSFEDWRAIVIKAKEQAKKGDSVARAWLGKVLGVEIDRHEVSGTGGGAIIVRWVDPDDS